MGNERDAAFTRREALTTLALGGAALVTGCAGAAHVAAPPAHSAPTTGDRTMTIPTALAGNHAVVPLPFAAGSLNGLSERMISSHHENNYGGAVRNLNRAEQELSQITTDTPPFVVAALRDRELTFRNSKTLHEAYFANLGGNGRRSGAIENAIAQAYGTTARWEQHMRATGMGLGGGSGMFVVFVQVEGEAFERRVVRLGARDRGYVEVLGGLHAGEHVVTRGAWSVKLAASSGSIPAHGHAH